MERPISQSINQSINETFNQSPNQLIIKTSKCCFLEGIKELWVGLEHQLLNFFTVVNLPFNSTVNTD